MSNSQKDSSAVVQAHEAPRYERWLGISSASCLPIALTFALPRTFLAPLLAAAAILLATGLVMLLRQTPHPDEVRSNGS